MSGDQVIDAGALKGFPELPKYEGIWHAVYFTPIMGSSERLTAFVIARGNDGQTCIRQTIRPELLEMAFGPKIEGIFSLVHASLVEWSAKPDADWFSPVSSFKLGERRRGLANNVRQLAAQGIVMEAAFAASEFADLNQP